MPTPTKKANVTTQQDPNRHHVVYRNAYSQVARNVTHITIDSSSVLEIGERTFHHCTLLLQVDFEGIHLRCIHPLAFWGCTSLQQIAMPNTVEQLGSGSFKDCTSLSSVKLSELLELIKEDTFCNCMSLTHLTPVPANVKRIEKFAFSRCTSLAEVDLQEGRLALIEACAFEDCTSLTEVSLPSSVQTIAVAAFQNCVSLKELKVPLQAALCKIQKNAFRGCVSLESVQLPSSLASIHSRAFHGCDKLCQLKIANNQTRCSFRAIFPFIKFILNRLIKLDEVYGVSKWKSDMQSIVSESGALGVRQNRLVLDLSARMERHRRCEATSTVELTLWKKELKEHPYALRANCRVTCGADLVLENVTEYLWDPPPTSSSSAETCYCSIGPL